MPPLHVIEIDSRAYMIRRDFYGRYQVYRATPEGLEQSVGRIQGYRSVKECWDALFERTIQPDTHENPLIEFARFMASHGDEGQAKAAREAIAGERIPLS
jgi:hypothetical protein